MTHISKGQLAVVSPINSHLITQPYQLHSSIRMPAQQFSLCALASYNHCCSSMAHNNNSHPYPLYQDVYCCSVDPSGDDGFSNLNLRNFLDATCHISHQHMAQLHMSGHNSKLLSRSLQSRMDNREERNKVAEACLG